MSVKFEKLMVRFVGLGLPKLIAVRIVVGFFLALLVSPVIWAQTQTASLRGQVTDPSGAAVAMAKVTLNASSGPVATATTSSDGSYAFNDVMPGGYTVGVSAPQLELPQAAEVTLRPGPQTLDLRMQVASVTQQIEVQETANTVTPEASNNASAVVLAGTDLASLSDDPTQLQADLEALAGPSAGPGANAILLESPGWR